MFHECWVSFGLCAMFFNFSSCELWGIFWLQVVSLIYGFNSYPYLIPLNLFGCASQVGVFPRGCVSQAGLFPRGCDSQTGVFPRGCDSQMGVFP